MIPMRNLKLGRGAGYCTLVKGRLEAAGMRGLELAHRRKKPSRLV